MHMLLLSNIFTQYYRIAIWDYRDFSGEEQGEAGGVRRRAVQLVSATLDVRRCGLDAVHPKRDGHATPAVVVQVNCLGLFTWQRVVH